MLTSVAKDVAVTPEFPEEGVTVQHWDLARHFSEIQVQY